MNIMLILWMISLVFAIGIPILAGVMSESVLCAVLYFLLLPLPFLLLVTWACATGWSIRVLPEHP